MMSTAWILGLVETPSFGAIEKRKRLDKVISSMEWRTTFGNAEEIHLNAIQLDHAPILLNLYLDHPKLQGPF